MSAPKWTPGPWYRHPDAPVRIYSATVANASVCLVRLNCAMVISDEENANANLIVAAPDLYEALERMLRLAELLAPPESSHQGPCGPESGCDGGCEELAAIADTVARGRAALAKAMGEYHQPDDGRDGRDDLDDRDPMQIAAERCPPRE